MPVIKRIDHSGGARSRASVTSGLTRVGMKAARAVSAEMLDRAKPDKFAELRQAFYDADNPEPGDAYDRLVAAGGKFVPPRGRLLCRRSEAWREAKAAGLVIPKTADVHRGSVASAEYTVLARGSPCDPEAVDPYWGSCSGACMLPVGTVVIAPAHLGADLRAWGGPELFLQRCNRIAAVVDA